jgi:phosphoribosylformimino-5-aminoimidazole carboxamide ribonucleotide (ProFAR) isomerase
MFQIMSLIKKQIRDYSRVSETFAEETLKFTKDIVRNIGDTITYYVDKQNGEDSIREVAIMEGFQIIGVVADEETDFEHGIIGTSYYETATYDTAYDAIYIIYAGGCADMKWEDIGMFEAKEVHKISCADFAIIQKF